MFGLRQPFENSMKELGSILLSATNGVVVGTVFRQMRYTIGFSLQVPVRSASVGWRCTGVRDIMSCPRAAQFQTKKLEA